MLKYFNKVADEKSWLPDVTTHENLDLLELPSDPGQRPIITEYHPNIRESVRRKYYSNGPCQPRLDEFPQRKIDGKLRRTMLKYFKKVADEKSWLPNVSSEKSVQVELLETTIDVTAYKQPRAAHENLDLLELPSDPGQRPIITEYHPNIRESVRRKYYSNGPCQPRLDEFPQRKIDGKLRRFNHSWFKEFGWLEYSVSVDASFCLCCYLFKNKMGHQEGGDTFVTEGFRDWKNKEKLRKHEGGPNSAHRQALS
ncbi:hypothetical protein OROHE_004738 [Orobanche hederae]